MSKKNLHLLWRAMLAATGLAASSAVLACADEGCSPPLALQLTAERCGLAGLPFLSADNDTRINLALLAAAKGAAPLTGWDLDKHSATPLVVPFAISDLQAVMEEEPASSTDFVALAKSLGVSEESLNAANERAAGWLEGRCALNRPAAAIPFLSALQQSGLNATEQTLLAEQRVKLLGLCQSDTLPELGGLPTDGIAGGFARYLQGVRAFYLGDFATAHTLFTALAAESQPWLKETASYLLARVAINQAQAAAADEMGGFDPAAVDKAPLAEAEKYLDAYLAAYPKGSYADSARGLYRRIYWLQDDMGKLSARYQALLPQLKDPRQNALLINEIDLRLHTSSSAAVAPEFLLVSDLQQMRSLTEWEAKERKPIQADQIASQQAAFSAAGEQQAFAYLQQAQRYYVQQDYAGLSKEISAPAAGGKLELIPFSQQMLRGMSLLAQKQWPEAEAHWQQLWNHQPDALQQPLLQLAMALTLERANHLDALFAADSWVTLPSLRTPLLLHVAPAELLRQLAQTERLSGEERNTALFTLLYKELMAGRYGEFIKDSALLAGQPQPKAPYDLTLFALGAKEEEGYSCPALAESLGTLQKNGKSVKALNCLGEFIYRQGWDYSPLGEAPAANELGGSPTRFAAPVAGRLALYRQVIADDKAPAEERSYALYRAINCYATSGYNHCGSEDLPKEERKRWFMTLKKQYAKTAWAQQLKYYW